MILLLILFYCNTISVKTIFGKHAGYMRTYESKFHLSYNLTCFSLSFRSALQTLHKVSAKAREGNYYQGGGTHSWVEHYEARVASDRSCLNEWHAMDCLESRRPPSPDSVRARPTEREETEKVMRCENKIFKNSNFYCKLNYSAMLPDSPSYGNF